VSPVEALLPPVVSAAATVRPPWSVTATRNASPPKPPTIVLLIETRETRTPNATASRPFRLTTVWLNVVGCRAATTAVPVRPPAPIGPPVHVTVVVPTPRKPREQAFPISSDPSGRVVSEVNAVSAVHVIDSPPAVSSASAPTSDHPATGVPPASVTRTSDRVAVEVVPVVCWYSAGRTVRSTPV